MQSRFNFLILKRRLRSILASLLTRDSALGAAVYLAIAFEIALVLGLSGLIQTFFFAAISGPRADLYSTAYPESFNQWPMYWDFFQKTWAWEYLIVGIATSSAIFLSRQPREFILRVSIASGLSLLFIDVLWAPHLTVQYALENIVADAIAGVLIASLLLLQRQFISFVLGSATNIPFRATVSTSMSLLLGLVAWTLIFLAMKFFYNPTESHLALTAKPKFSGWRLAYERDGAGKPKVKPEDRFSVLEKPITGTLPFDYIYIETPISVSWKADTAKSYEIGIVALANCSGRELKNAVKRMTPTSFVAVKAFQISMQKGMGTFVGNPNGEHTAFSARPPKTDEVYPFTVAPGEKKGTVTVHRFLRNASIHYWPPRQGVQFYLSSMMFEFKKPSTINPAPKNLLIDIDGKQHKLRFVPTFNERSRPICRRAPLTLGKTQEIASDGQDLGLLVEIRPREVSQQSNAAEHDAVIVNSEFGWLSVDNIEQKDLDEFVTPGKINAISLSDGIERAEVNGEVQDVVGPTTVYFSKGDVHADVSDGSLFLDGDVGVLSIKNKRKVFTRWETLNSAERGGLFTIFGSVFLYCFNLLLGILKGNSLFPNRP